MKNGILRNDEGYDIYKNGVRHTFADLQSSAFEAARYAKSKNKGVDKVEIVDRSTGKRIEMLADGQTR